MQIETKITCYQELYTQLKNSEILSDFGWPNQKEHLDFYFNIGKTKIFFRIFSDKDMMQIRSETIRNENNNFTVAQNISQNYYGILGTDTDGVLTFSLSVPFSSIADDAAKQLIFDKTNYFINMITTEIEKEYVEKIKKENELLLKENDNLSRNKKKKLVFFSRKKTPDEQSEPLEDIDERNGINVKEENNDYLSDISNLSSITQDINANSFINDIAECSHGKLDTEEKASLNKEKSSINDTEKKSSVNYEKDLSNEVIHEHACKIEEVKNSPEKTETFSLPELDIPAKDEKEEIQVDLENDKINDVSSIDSNLNENINYTLSKKDDIEYNSVTTVNEEKNIAKEELSKKETNTSLEKEDPNISALYEKMNRTFDIKKEQLDYREQMLAEQKQFLQYEKDALLKEAEDIKLKKLENKGKEETLKKSWEQYQKAKRRQEATSGKLNKRETVIKMQEDEITKKLEEVEKRESSLSARENEIINIQEEIERSKKEYEDRKRIVEDYEEKLRLLEKEISENELKIKVQTKQNEMERQAIDEKLADLKEAEEMFKMMKNKLGVTQIVGNTDKTKELQDEIKQLHYQIELLNEDLSEKTNQLSQVSQKALLTEKLYDTLQQSYDEMKQQNSVNTKHETNETLIKELRGTIEDLKEKMQASESEYQRHIVNIQSKYECLMQENAQLKNEFNNKIEQDIVTVLAKEGFTALSGTKNGKNLLTFSLGGCKVWIDDECHVAEIEKATKRNYAKQVQELNELSHTLSFCLGKGKVYCRFAYQDIAKEIRENIAIMVKFK